MSKAKPTNQVSLIKPDSSKTSSDFLIVEYTALRAEILKRSEFQHQMISLALIATGTFLSLGLQSDSTTIILIYPFLSMFLASTWAQNDFWIRNVAYYIHYYIEDNVASDNLGWEHNNPPSSRLPLFGSLSLFASRGIFIGSQILAILISLIRTKFSTQDVVLLMLDALVIVFTLILLRRRKPTVAKPS